MVHGIKRWCHHSATIGVARAMYIAGIGLEVAAHAADFLNAIGAGVLVPPNYVGVYTVSVAAIVEVARRRTLKKAC